jgi:LmbE family N-acetylglucosaminyl deacetylase
MMHRALLLVLVSAAALRSQAPEAGSFTFRDGGGPIVSVMLEAADATMAMTWPETAARGWDTALLDVAVNVGFEGPAPFVEIASAGRSDRQYFRAGETGPRWLNLSFLRGAVAGGTRVSFRTQGVHMEAGAASLRLFANGLDLSRPLLVLAPHPDDAEIAAFGIYAHRKATVVTITTGNAGPRNYGAVFDDVAAMYHFKGRIRLIDSITVPWLGGIPPERAFNLGYFDARLAEMHDQPAAVIPEMYGPNTDIGAYLKYNIGTLLPKRPRASTWANLVDDLETVLKKVNPAVIVASHPQLDSHADHQFATVALAEALARRRQRVALLLYTNHADRNRYPYGPAGTIMSMPPPEPQEVLLDRVYSHPVSPALQRDKLFALESMHDLRSSPSRLYQLEIGGDRSTQLEELGPASMAGVSYLRRAPRSNELFFVYDQVTVKPMIDAFLTAWRARPTKKPH